MSITTRLAVIICTAFLIAGCSANNDNIVTTPESGAGYLGEHETRVSRILWGIWDIRFDNETMTVEITPARIVEAHWNITPMVTPPACVDCVGIKINSFNQTTRIMDVSATLKNPTAIAAYDVRGILFTDDKGHRLMNPDDWTAHWDIPGGMNLNPFRAFAKDAPNRQFNGLVSHTEKYQVFIPKPPAYASIRYAVDVSWPGNCKEPYRITCPPTISIPSYSGTPAYLGIEVDDWQDDVEMVTFSAPDIIGVGENNFQHISGKMWGLEVANDEVAAPGDYQGIIKAMSSGSGTTGLYEVITVSVVEGWARTWGGVDSETAYAVAPDNYGNIYVLSYFWGTSDFDPGPGSDEYTPVAQSDAALSKYDSSGNYIWTRVWGGDGGDYVSRLAITDAGDIVISGSFNGTADFDPGPGVEEHTSESTSDSYLLKLNSAGNFMWVDVWGGPSFDSANDLALDSTGNIYVSHQFRALSDFDPGPGVDEHTSGGSYDAALTKFGPDGSYIWGKSWGAADADLSNVICLDKSGDVYVAGWFEGTVDFDPGVPVAEHTSNDAEDIFLSKFDSDGVFQWVATWGGVDSDKVYGLRSDNFDGIYICGYIYNTVDFDPGPGVAEQTSSGLKDPFLSKLNTAGEYQWARVWGGSTGSEYTYQLAIDSAANVYIAGDFASPTDFDPGPGLDEKTTPGDKYDIFVAKYNSSGDYLWVTQLGGDDDDTPYGIAVEPGGTIYLAGEFRSTVDFDPGASTDNHVSAGYTDGFLCKLLPNGLW